MKQRSKMKGRVEQKQFWRTGNIGNQECEFWEQGNMTIYFKGTRKKVHPWKGLVLVLHDFC